MKKGFLKSLCLLLALLILPCAAMLTAHAEEDVREWTASENLSSLYDGINTYYRYPIPEEYDWAPLLSVYNYVADSVTVRETGTKLTASLQTTAPDSGLVLLRSNGKAWLYATREAAQVLTRYFSAPSHTNCFLWEGPSYGAAISDERLSCFYDPAHIELIDIEVTELRELDSYELVSFDPNLALVRTVGAVYQLDGERYGFVDYTLLDNTHFDASGDFSYRSGSVTLSVLKGDAYAALMETVDTMDDFDWEITYENDPDMATAGLVIFWIFFVLVGYVMPLAPLLVGLLLPQSAKRHRPKRWYALAVFAGLWLLAATVILIILL